MRIPILLLLASWMAAGHGATREDPAVALQALVVAEGFEVSLFASEADGVVNPIQARFDPRGRLYVACSTIYPQIEPGQKPDDKILVLEDTTGDGRADKTTVFADDLMIPTGLEYGDGGIYVGNAAELLHLRDTTGDGKADQRRVVLRGFGTGDSHQNINSFTWGPGGELMFSQGLHAFSRVETPWGIVRLHEAGIWRLRPRLLRLDGFFGDGMAPHNPWGFAFDDWGQMIIVAGNGHGIFYGLPILIRNHDKIPYLQIWEDYRGRKLSGADIIGTRHFPEELQGMMVAGGYLNNNVQILEIEENGSGFRVRDHLMLLASTRTSFRPVDVKTGPDGAIYVVDWHNPIIGHYQASFRHPERDKTHGRIWRVTAKNRPLVEPPQLETLSVPALLDQLKSPERWNRYQAKRLLDEAPTVEVTAALAQWLEDLDENDPRYEHYLFEALGVYEMHEIIEAGLLSRLLNAGACQARAYAAGVLAHWHEKIPEALPWLQAAVRDAHPRVRLAAVVSLAHIPAAEALPPALEAVDAPLDPFLEYALQQNVRVLKPHWLPSFVRGELKLANPRHLQFLVQADRSPDVLEALVGLVESPTLSSQEREPILHLLPEVGEPAHLGKILGREWFTTNGRYDPDLHARVIDSLAEASRLRKTQPSGNLAQAVRPLLTQEKTERAALQLVAQWRIEDLREEIRRLANAPASMETRQAALRTLGAIGTSLDQELLQRLALEAEEPSLRLGAIEGLAAMDLPRAASAAAQFLEQAEGETLDQVLILFLQRTGGSAALASSLSTHPPPARAARSMLQFLHSAGRQETVLIEVLNHSIGMDSQSWAFTPSELEAFMAEVNEKGDAIRGKEVYHRPELGCISCHSGEAANSWRGPDLSSIGASQPVDFIIGAILDPAREIKEGYQAFEILTRDGETYQGYVSWRDGQEILFRDLALNREIRLGRNQVESERSIGSLMPEGLVDSLSREEFRDLIRYLSELGRPPASGRREAPNSTTPLSD